MVIRYCASCYGKPYTDDITQTICPVCGSKLLTEMVSDSYSLDDREMLVFSIESEKDDFLDELLNKHDDGFSFDDEIKQDERNSFYEDDFEGDKYRKTDTHELSQYDKVGDISSSNSNMENSFFVDDNRKVIGRVVNYSCSLVDNDKSIKRSFLKKMYHYIMYGQKTDDVLHRFNLYRGASDDLGYSHSQSVPVNIYGGISDGMGISENDVLEIYGKYNTNNVFMGKEAYINNQGNRIKLHFRHSPKFIVDCICSLIVLVLIVFTAINYDASFVEGLGAFIKTWIIMAIVFLVLYFAVFKWIALIKIVTGKGGIPVSGVLFSSFIATLLYMNRSLIWASTGSAIMGFLKPIIITIIFFAVIIFLLKMLIGL